MKQCGCDGAYDEGCEICNPEKFALSKSVCDLAIALDKFIYEKPVLTTTEKITVLPMLMAAFEIARGKNAQKSVGECGDCKNCEYDKQCGGGL
jgi:hypothetical protein